MKGRQLAQQVARHMFERDNCSRALGMELLKVAPGIARMRMKVRSDMLNGHGTCHGGILFCLADSAFAFACNADNHVTVALACQINFVAPAMEGDCLFAVARELSKTGRTGVYDVSVTREDGTLVAIFRGHAYRTRGHVVEPEKGEED